MNLLWWVVLVSGLAHASSNYTTYVQKQKEFLSVFSSYLSKIIKELEETEELVDTFVNVTRDEISLYHYGRWNVDDFTTNFTLSDMGPLRSIFHPWKESVFIIHDWRGSLTSDVNKYIRKAVLGKHDVNLFVVEWPSSKGFVHCYDLVPYIGQYLGELLNHLTAEWHYSLSKVTLVGYGLGAHIAGRAGRETNGLVGRIVGLDPAGPIFNVNREDVDARLSRDDGQFVEVIHTNSALHGINYSVGDADYYPNGGRMQPGNTLLEDFISEQSHAKSYKYYAESIARGGFEAYSFAGANPFNRRKSHMGGYFLDLKARGDYYLQTNVDYPYARGRKFV